MGGVRTGEGVVGRVRVALFCLSSATVLSLDSIGCGAWPF